MKIPITIVGVSGGFGYVEAGPTHHSIEDIAIMRVIPHMTVHSISDNTMAQAIAEKSCTMKHPNYIRLDREVLPYLYDDKEDFSKGLSVFKKGKIYIIAAGSMTHMALKLASMLEKDGIDLGVIDLYELPIRKDSFMSVAKEAEAFITIEEHFYPGGLGSAVCEILQDNRVMLPVKRIALDQPKGYSYRYGSRDSLREYYQIDAPHIIKKIVEFVQTLPALKQKIPL